MNNAPANGYATIYRQLEPALASLNLAEAATRLGFATTAEGVVLAPFCGRLYCIGSDGVRFSDGRLPDERDRTEICLASLLIHYLLSPSAELASAEFVPSALVTALKIEGSKAEADPPGEPLVRAFADRYTAFARAAGQLGGRLESERGGSHIWLFPLLPRIGARLLFHEADEELSAEIHLQYTANCQLFLNHECMAVLSNSLVQLLVAAGRA